MIVPQTSNFLVLEIAGAKSSSSEIMVGLMEGEDFAPAISNTKTFDVCGTIISFVATRTGYHDLTGALPHKSS